MACFDGRLHRPPAETHWRRPDCSSWWMTRTPRSCRRPWHARALRCGAAHRYPHRYRGTPAKRAWLRRGAARGIEWLRQRSRPPFSNSILGGGGGDGGARALEHPPAAGAAVRERPRPPRHDALRVGSQAREHPIIPGCSGSRPRRPHVRAPPRKASTSSASPTPWCRRDRRASARRYPLSARSSSKVSRHLTRVGRELQVAR